MTQPPIVPGSGEPPTQPQIIYVQQAPAADQNAGLRQAGTVALWVWIVLTLIPVVLIGGCVLLCLFSGIMGAATQPSN